MKSHYLYRKTTRQQ